jgi:hypothetical protein
VERNEEAEAEDEEDGIGVDVASMVTMATGLRTGVVAATGNDAETTTTEADTAGVADTVVEMDPKAIGLEITGDKDPVG